MKVLLIEPDREFASIVSKYLSNNGNTVDHQLSAQKAIHAADAKQPDIVVLELAMPEHNGVAFLHEFRSYDDWANVPVIIYSHIPLESSGLRRVDWQVYGVLDYLYKPTARLEALRRSMADIYEAAH